jgi:hypothetical protein
MPRTYTHRTSNTCSIEGCEAPFLARGWCSLHYSRWKTHGDPLTILDRRQDDAKYDAAHARVRSERGKASYHECEKCGKEARDWSYDGSDPNERICPRRGCVYSLDPRYYRPLCRSCHLKGDGVAPIHTRSHRAKRLFD